MLTQHDKDYIHYIEQIWKEDRNKKYFKNAIAINSLIFPYIMQCLSDCDDIAYISLIEEAYVYEINNVQTYNNTILYYDIIGDDKFMRILNFIESNLDKHIFVCCKDGKEYARGICKFIFNMFPEKYAEEKVNYYNPCIITNTNIIIALKKAYVKKHHVY